MQLREFLARVLLEVDSQAPTDIWLEEKEAVMFPRQLTKATTRKKGRFICLERLNSQIWSSVCATINFTAPERSPTINFTIRKIVRFVQVDYLNYKLL